MDLQLRWQALVLKDSTSLYRIASDELQSIYEDAVEDAADDHRGLGLAAFSNERPHTVEHLLRQDLFG